MKTKMKKRAIACGLLLIFGLAGCMEEGGASVPKGAGADTIEADKGDQAGTPKTKRPARLSNVAD